jgi:hypothetical protein
MIKVRVVNQASPRWGQVGFTSKKNWNSAEFWVEVAFGGQVALLARRNLLDF